MALFVARVIKHLVILLLGVGVAYLAVDKVYPYFDKRTYDILAVFATYLVVAYGLIPLAFRVFRALYHPAHLPLYSTTPDGFASDPVNIVVVGSRRQVILAMEAAGWRQADPKTPVSVLRQIVYILLRRSYPSAPMSSLFLFGREQDLAFEKEIVSARGHRHHVRFWAADTILSESFDRHVRFWQRFHLPKNTQLPNAKFWVGAASKDVGYALIRHNAQITHLVSEDTRSERRLIVKDLRGAGRLASSRTVPAYRPLSLPNRAWRARLNSDGYVTICELR